MGYVRAYMYGITMLSLGGVYVGSLLSLCGIRSQISIWPYSHHFYGLWTQNVAMTHLTKNHVTINLIDNSKEHRWSVRYFSNKLKLNLLLDSLENCGLMVLVECSLFDVLEYVPKNRNDSIPFSQFWFIPRSCSFWSSGILVLKKRSKLFGLGASRSIL